MACDVRFYGRDEPSMVARSISKWTAFLLSACVPGAGQLAAGSWTCLGWFAIAGLLGAGTIELQRQLSNATWLLAVQAVCGISLAIFSAEHAKRLLETAAEIGGGTVVASSCRSRSRGSSFWSSIRFTIG